MDRPEDNNGPQRVRYTLSNDPDFDVARLKSIHDSRYVRLLDRRTGQCIALKPQQYVQLFSDNMDKLRELINGILAKNAFIMESDIADKLKRMVDKAVENLLNDLKIINFRGDVAELPTNGMRIGDVVRMNGLYYIYFGGDYNGHPPYRRVYFEGDEFPNYYTKQEFDELYANNMALISSWLRHDIEQYTEDFYGKFLTKDDANRWISMAISSMQAYQESVAAMTSWRDEKSAQILDYMSEVDALSSTLYTLSSDIAGMVTAWIEQKRNEYDSYVALVSARYDELYSLAFSLNERIDAVEADVSSLSTAFKQIINGKQEILEVGYEA